MKLGKKTDIPKQFREHEKNLEGRKPIKLDHLQGGNIFTVQQPDLVETTTWPGGKIFPHLFKKSKDSNVCFFWGGGGGWY